MPAGWSPQRPPPRDAAGGGDGGPAEPRQRLHGVIELEVVDALLLELLGRGGEARIGLAVILDDVVGRPPPR